MEGDRLQGKAQGPHGEWPISDIRLNGDRLTFKVHNGEEHLEADLKCAGEEFVGYWAASSTEQGGRLRMRRPK